MKHRAGRVWNMDMYRCLDCGAEVTGLDLYRDPSLSEEWEMAVDADGFGVGVA